MAKLSRVTILTIGLVCLLVVNARDQQKDDKKDDAIQEKTCKKFGFSKPIKRAEINECNVMCYSKDDTLVEHLEKEGKCSWEGKTDSVCRYGECYDAIEKPEMDMDDYAVVEIMPKKYVLNDGKLEENVEFDAFVASLPKDSLTYQEEQVFCSCPAGNKAGVKSVDFKTVCKTRLLNKKAKLGFSISTSKGQELDVVNMDEKLGKKLDKGAVEFKTKKGTFTVELKTGTRNTPPKEEPSDTTKPGTQKPKRNKKKKKKPKTTTTTTTTAKPKEDNQEDEDD